MKRLFSLFLVCVLTCAVWGACPAREAALAENVGRLRVMVRQNNCEDVALVSEAISEITREKLNADVELVFINAGDYNSKIPLMIASDEVMDIGYDASFLDYVNRARTGAYLDITGLLDEFAPELWDVVDEALWMGATVDGGVYGVPTKKEIAEEWALYAETEFLESAGLDVSGVETLADIEPVLAALSQVEGRAGYMMTASANAITIAQLAKYDRIVTDNSLVACIDKAEGKTVANYYATEDFEEFVYLMRDWYLKGYIAEDVATRENYKDYTESMNYGVGYVSYSPLAEVNASANYGKDLTVIPVTPITVTNNSACGSINCVYAKCGDPELAVRFLLLWNTDSEIKNLVTYGIEGVHYTLNAAGKLEHMDGYDVKYANANYRVGNMFISYLLAGEADDKWARYEAFNAAATTSVALGFQPVTADIEDKLAVINAIVKEYAYLLAVGCVDPDVYLPMFREQLTEAGVDEVIASFQGQYDAWRID